MASKKVARWPEADRAWLLSLPLEERNCVLLLAAYLDARPPEEKPDGE